MFPLLVDALKTFQNLKSDIENSAVTIDKHMPFVMQRDASNLTIAPTLNQGERSVDLFLVLSVKAN